jgi:hypothetical protein
MGQSVGILDDSARPQFILHSSVERRKLVDHFASGTTEGREISRWPTRTSRLYFWQIAGYPQNIKCSADRNDNKYGLSCISLLAEKTASNNQDRSSPQNR